MWRSRSLLASMADAQLQMGQVDAAHLSVERGLAFANDPAVATIRQVLIATDAAIALRQGQVAHARALIERRFADVDLKHTLLPDRDAHEIAYRVYLAAHDDEAALSHLAALKRLDDQATEIARSNSAALAAARFDYANQELRIAKLKADDLSRTVAFERATAQTQRTIFGVVAITALLVVAMLAAGLFLLRRSRNEVRAANDDLAASNAELAKALRIKTEFLATTSHEIRTPLNGILGMTQVMIADGAIDATMRDRLSVVHGAGVTMRALVDDILDVAKIETGRMTIEVAPIDLRATVEEAARLWREPAAAKGLAYAVSLHEAPGWVLGDSARLRQIVFNLLSNAVKFTATGHVALTVRTVGERIRLIVEDSGIGIAPAAHELIFESFRQADAGTTRQYGGTGLGLSICRNLARAMGGDVTVSSSEGRGRDLRSGRAATPRGGVRSGRGRGTARTAGGGGQSDPPRDVCDAVRRDRRHRLRRAGRGGGRDRAAGAGAGADRSRRASATDIATAVAAAGEAPVLVLHAAGDVEARARHFHDGATQVVEKPIGKKELVVLVDGLSSRLALAAA
ncbi:sensor histidine kinase [Sphingomonas adhaesiva]|uniref:sensor histidine kinase n=1 Tax=Sphingomonas adhaesiva TaxID=28212 RepID=UPI002FFD5517